MNEGMPKREASAAKKLLLAAAMAALAVYYISQNEPGGNLIPDDLANKEYSEIQIKERLVLLQEKHNLYYKEPNKEKRASIMTSSEIQEMRAWFIYVYGGLAQDMYQKYKIPPMVSMGQAMNESGSGSSDLAMQAQNYFGIKCHQHSQKSNIGKEMDHCKGHTDDVVEDRFLKHKDIHESFVAYAKLISRNKDTNGRYRNAFDCDYDDYRCWITAIKDAGYATDPDYVDKIVRIIEDNKLPEKLGKGMTYDILGK